MVLIEKTILMNTLEEVQPPNSWKKQQKKDGSTQKCLIKTNRFLVITKSERRGGMKLTNRFLVISRGESQCQMC